MHSDPDPKQTLTPDLTSLSFGMSISSFSTDRDGTDGHRWDFRPSRLPNVLKVKSPWRVCGALSL